MFNGAPRRGGTALVSHALLSFLLRRETVGRSARRVASVRSVLEILGVSGDPLLVLGVSQRWRVERPRNSGRKWRPSCCFRCVGALARGASSEFSFQSLAFKESFQPRLAKSYTAAPRKKIHLRAPGRVFFFLGLAVGNPCSRRLMGNPYRRA